MGRNHDYEITNTDILDFEAVYGAICTRFIYCFFVPTESKRWPSQDAIRNLDQQGIQHTPGGVTRLWNI